METAQKEKFPFAFYVCCITFALERGAYYSSKFLIYIFLLSPVVEGGLGLDKGVAAGAQANLVAFTYLAPILGGYICDRFLAAKIAIPLGMFFMAAGYYMGSRATDMTGVNIMIWLVVIGTGFFKGNISALNGRLFDNQDRLDAAFSTQYSFVNIGSFIGTTAVGILYTKTFYENGVYGFSQCFLIAAVICAIAGVLFIATSKSFGEHGSKPFAVDAVKEDIAEIEKTPLTKSEKNKIVAICIVSLFSVIFWIFWYLTYLAAYDYGAESVNMFVGGFEIPLAWFDSLNAFMCIALGPVFGVMWTKLAARPQGDVSLFKKTSFGLAFLGLSFLMLIGGEMTRGDGQASLLWLILFGILLSVGEMLFSPLGNAFVSKYAPARFLSMLMGVWIIASFFAGKLYGGLYTYLSENFSVTSYSLIVFVILMISAAVIYLSDSKLSKLLED